MRVERIVAGMRDELAASGRTFFPAELDRWLHEAEPSLRRTARAVHALSGADGARRWANLTTLYDGEGEAGTTAASTARSAEEGIVRRAVGSAPGRAQEAETAPPVRGLEEMTATEAVRAVRRGDASPVDVVRKSLARLEATEAVVQAWVTRLQEEALAAARRVERALLRGEDPGPLPGLPFGVKDNIFAAGLPAEAGSKLYAGFTPRRDAAVVQSLRAAGAVLMGKTTTSELALGDPPPTRNPRRPGHTPGGSSGGSAAAVAAGHVPFALGTQTGGSLNRPAGYCGVFAFKPTFGAVPRRGVLPLSPSLDHVGLMAQHAADLQLVAEALGWLPVADPPGPAEDLRLKIGRPGDYFTRKLHPAQKRGWHDALRWFQQRLGAVVVDVEPPPDFDLAVAAHTVIMQWEAAALYRDDVLRRGRRLGPTVRARLLAGLATDGAVYVRARQVQKEFARRLTSLLRDTVDVVVTPTSPTPAPPGLQTTGSSEFNSPFTLAGLPTIVLPVGRDRVAGLPLSVQLVAAPERQRLLFTLAAAYEAQPPPPSDAGPPAGPPSPA